MSAKRNHDLRPAIDVSQYEAVLAAAGKIDDQVRVLVSDPGGWPAGAKRECFVTYATPEYALGLVVLLRTLRRHSQRPIVVLTDRRWTFEPKTSGVFFVAVPSLENLRYAPDRPEIRATLTKLWIFALLSLERVVYIDADCLVLKPIDDLFDLAGCWCAPDYVEEPRSRRFNSGLIAFDPSAELRNKIYAEAHLAHSYDHGDQGLLNSIVWSEVNFLPPEYSVTRHYHFFHGAEMRSSDVRVVHYIVKKPWDLWYRETPDTALNELDDLWTAELDHRELLALVSVWRRRQFTFERARLESLHQRRSPIVAALGSRRVRYFLAAVIGGILLVILAGSLALILDAVAALVR